MGIALMRAVSSYARVSRICVIAIARTYGKWKDFDSKETVTEIERVTLTDNAKALSSKRQDILITSSKKGKIDQ